MPNSKNAERVKRLQAAMRRQLFNIPLDMRTVQSLALQGQYRNQQLPRVTEEAVRASRKRALANAAIQKNRQREANAQKRAKKNANDRAAARAAANELVRQQGLNRLIRQARAAAAAEARMRNSTSQARY